MNIELPEINTFTRPFLDTTDYMYGAGRINPCTETILSEPKKCVLPFEEEEEMSNSSRRLVRVLVVDPDERLPLALAILIDSPEQFTDLNNQELFFELDIKNKLDNHNTVRTTIIDTEASKKSGKDEYLEPIKIRDLKMVVIEIATF